MSLERGSAAVSGGLPFLTYWSHQPLRVQPLQLDVLWDHMQHGLRLSIPNLDAGLEAPI